MGGHAQSVASALLLSVWLVACTGAQPGGADQRPSGTASSQSTLICGVEWTTRNLDVSAYRNGDAVPQVQDPEEWAKLTTGAWCWYDHDGGMVERYGKLYNWYAVNDPRGLAPAGWHVLSAGDWEDMEACLGEDSVGYRMRATGAADWPGPATAADNSSGFKGLPSGMRVANGTFSAAGSSAVFWTSTEGSANDAWCGRLIHYVNKNGVPAMVTGVGYMNKAEGYAVRCVKDR